MAKKSIEIDIESAEKVFKTQKSESNKDRKEQIGAEQQNESTPQQSPEPVRNRVGRPRNRTFTKKDAIPLTIFFPADMKDTIESASFFGKVDQSDIVRAAVKMFLKEHSNGSQLKPSGIAIVRDYITETTVK